MRVPPALADPDQLRIVLSNLIRNALDAMPSGGTLTLSGRGGESIEVAVADTGIGIPAEQLTRITEPLFTTKAKGLALARAILEKNRGSLHVVSQSGVGTTFTIRLTVAPEARAV
jgi:two-component system sensor kinase FixL